MFAYSVAPSSYSVFLIKERETGVKQLLLISGTGKVKRKFSKISQKHF